MLSFDLIFSRFTVLQFKTHMFILIYLKPPSFLMDYTRFVRLFIRKYRSQHTRFFLNAFKCSKLAKSVIKVNFVLFQVFVSYGVPRKSLTLSLFSFQRSMYLFLNVFVSSSNDISSCLFLFSLQVTDGLVYSPPKKKIAGNCQSF